MEIKQNVSLVDYTSFKVGGPAKFFCEVKNEEDLKQAVLYARENNLEYFIIGDGSNIVVSDNGFKGLIINIKNKNIEIKDQEINVEAGLELSDLIRQSMDSSLMGLDALAMIPGTVGGAIYGNAGSFGKQIGDMINQVRVFDINTGEFKDLDKSECGFDYRSSMFKYNHHLIIYSATLRLEKGDAKEIMNNYQANCKYKKENLEWQPSAGCVFKNIDINNVEEGNIERIENEGGDLTKAKEVGKIAAGMLIDLLDLKGFSVGGAMVSKVHGNFIINTGKAKAEDIISLQSILKQKVRNKFGIQLELEQVLVGFYN